MLKCPSCGQRLEVVKPPLMMRQQAILLAIEHLKRDMGRLPTAPAIAAHVGRPLATVKVELHILEHDKYLHRPNGIKSGWDTNGGEDIVLVAVRTARAA